MANETQYKVRADLTLDTTRAASQATTMQRRIQDLGRRISGTSSLAGGLTRNLIAMGGAYVGINALSSAFRGLVGGATSYANELEKTRIGLTSVLAAVQGTDWDTAARTSGQVFEQMRNDSVKSVATAQQLFKLYQGIVGPISNAGIGLKTVRDMTLDAVNASGVLGVDLEQAQRDMSLMVRGVAGMDVKMFSLLRSTGAIAETTEQWNKNLSAQQRVEKLQTALAKFAPAGDRFAKSFAGVTSTFKGIREEFTRQAWQPVMNAMAASLGRINDKFIGNQETIEKRLQLWGDGLAKRLESVFSLAETGVDMLTTRWDETAAKIEKAQRLAAAVGKTAAVAGAVQLARPAVGGAITGVGTLMGYMGGGAAGAGAAGAAGAGVAAPGAGGAAAGLAALGPALGVAAAAAVVLGGAVLAVREQWAIFTDMFVMAKPFIEGMWQDLQGLFTVMAEALLPTLKVAGNLFMMALVPSLAVAGAAVRVVVWGLKQFWTVASKVATFMYDVLKPTFDALWVAIDSFVGMVLNAVNLITGDVARAHQLVSKEEPDVLEELGRRFAPGDYVAPWDPSNFKDQAKAPSGRATVVNDFRGSRIQVKQEFRDMDPDRVMVAMVDGLARQAEMRIQSGMVPALGR